MKKLLTVLAMTLALSTTANAFKLHKPNSKIGGVEAVLRILKDRKVRKSIGNQNITNLEFKEGNSNVAVYLLETASGPGPVESECSGIIVVRKKHLIVPKSSKKKSYYLTVDSSGLSCFDNITCCYS